MKDYSLDRESKKQYIVDMFVTDKKTITVVFADGTRFENIAFTNENIDRIAAIQESQGKKGVSNMAVFQKKQFIANLEMIGVTGASALVGATAISSLLGTTDPNGILTTTAAVTLVGFVPTFIHALKARNRVVELRKLKYRDQHRDELDSYLDYPNSLAGLKDIKHYSYCAQHGEDPYSVLAIDCFTQKELEKIVLNIERERDCSFDYEKKLIK